MRLQLHNIHCFIISYNYIGWLIQGWLWPSGVKNYSTWILVQQEVDYILYQKRAHLEPV